MTDEEFDAELTGMSHERRQAGRWFREMGFDAEQSICLSIAGAPPARVERALWQGCSLETAFDLWT